MSSNEEYVFCIGTCFTCHRTFAFNPLTVPSVLYEGQREPVCRTCMDEVNRNRKVAGLNPHPINPTAYEVLPADDLIYSD